MARVPPIDDGNNKYRAPIGEVKWIAKIGNKPSDKQITIIAHTWYEAREIASAELGESDLNKITVTELDNTKKSTTNSCTPPTKKAPCCCCNPANKASFSSATTNASKKT